MQPALIAVDWGSSSFRAYLMSAGAEVLDETASGDGIASVAAGAYPATLERLIGQWLDANPSAPVIASGMVGSRHGWREAPYVRCPAGPHDVAQRLTTVEADGRRVFLAPGLSTEDEAGLPDVMRGEETEIFGVADLGVHLGARLIVLPGSHSKWAEVEGGRVAAFKTFVTGELFQALRDHTIAGAFAKAAPAKAPGDAFALGVKRGAAASSGEAEGWPPRPPVRRARSPADGRARNRTTPANICPAFSSARKSARRGGSTRAQNRTSPAPRRWSNATSRRSRLLVSPHARRRRTPRPAGFFASRATGASYDIVARADAAGCDP